MTNVEFENLLDELLDHGIEITLKRVDGRRWYDLNSGMKSEIEVALIDGEAVWKGRYDMRGTFDDLDDLRWIGQNRLMCGRDYASAGWRDFMRGVE